jgi:hypothetical protein
MSSEGLESYIIRYKVIYTTVAFILGLIVAIGGYRLGSLNGQYVPASHFEVSGWILHIFGCAILYNSNNMYPSLWLMLVGLFTMFITQYRVQTNRKIEGHDQLDIQLLSSKFRYSMTGLVLGLFLAVLGIVLAENGANLCPSDWIIDWVTQHMSWDTLYFIEGHFGPLYLTGVVCLVLGIITIIVTRYRIRIHKDPEIVEQSKG